MDTIALVGDTEPSQLSAEQKLESYALMHKALLKSMNAYAVVLSILLASSFTGFSQAPKPLIDVSPSPSQAPSPSSFTGFSLTGFSQAPAPSSFTGISQAPKPLIDDSPSHASNWQRTFTYFNSFSFFSSVTGLLFYASSSCSPLLNIGATAPLQTPDLKVQKQIKLLANFVPKFFNLVFFFGVSLTCSVFAFVFAGLSAFPHNGGDQVAVIITSVIGGFVYIQALCICCADAYRLVSVNMRQDETLWAAIKKVSLFGKQEATWTCSANI